MYIMNSINNFFRKSFRLFFKKYYYKFLKDAESLDPRLQEIMENYIEKGPEVIKNVTDAEIEMFIV